MISYGIDIGTTTVRAIAVDIHIGTFGQRTCTPVAKPLCTFTPYLADGSLDEPQICLLIDAWIAENKLPGAETGTILFTGEAQRTSNSLSLSQALTSKWQGFLSAQLNPDLESRVAAYGSGAVELSSRSLGKPVVHIDIGGGTSNFARIENGEIIDTACLNLGCRKVVFDPNTKKILPASREGKYLISLAASFDPDSLSDKMVELILGYAQAKVTKEHEPLIVVPWKQSHPMPTTLSISGGVVECIDDSNPFRFGDLGPFVLRSLKNHNPNIVFSSQEGKATALGVSAFGFQFSGSSIHCDSGFAANPKNVPLYSETELFQLNPLPPLFAVAIEFRETESSKIEDYASKWRGQLEAHHAAGTQVLFLFPGNIGKTFGYFFAKTKAPRPQILVLDEITPEPCRTQVRTLDLTYSKETDRYLVVVKALHLFGREQK